MYPDIITQSRKTYLGMVTAMDDLVGSLINDLKASGMYEDSVIIFSSDNGGMLNLGATNYPLTGQKSTLFDGHGIIVIIPSNSHNRISHLQSPSIHYLFDRNFRTRYIQNEDELDYEIFIWILVSPLSQHAQWTLNKFEKL